MFSILRSLESATNRRSYEQEFGGKISKKRLLACTVSFICFSCNKSNSQLSTAGKQFVKEVESAKTNELTAETMPAGDVLTMLHEQGKLPRANKDEHGELTSEIMALSNGGEIVYPQARTFHFR